MSSANDPNTAAPQGSESARGSAPRAPKIEDSKLVSTYANFCRVTGTPEELIVDFGLNAQPIGGAVDTVAVTERIVMNFYTAKRLLQALAATVARHESIFGELEVDVQRRATRTPQA